MNQMVKFDGGQTGLQTMTEAEMLSVLKSSLYPGAKDESIKMVLGYCRAAGLDPMQKPVHIVPMSVSTGEKDSNGWDIKVMRDVVMPGIGLYRTQAARTGACAGISEPEFGPDHEEVLGEAKITYPLWCKVSVTRILPDGQKAVFTATERWKENYATKSAKSQEPNAMWKKRPYAQLAKCAEAQALRKAFPEFGAQPTADEMEGKEIDITPPAPEQSLLPQAKSAKAEPAVIDAEPAKANSPTASPDVNDIPASAKLIETLRKKMTAGEITDADVCKAFKIESVDGISTGLVNRIFVWLKDPSQAPQ